MRTDDTPAGVYAKHKPKRRYDKGERRHKHVGKSATAEIKFFPGNPRCWIGICPSPRYLPDTVRDCLLDDAIIGENGEREIDFIKKLYNVYNGVIYEAQTSDRGFSYHGYPYRGKLASSLIRELRAVAKKKGCESEFDSWVKEHIEKHGS